MLTDFQLIVAIVIFFLLVGKLFFALALIDLVEHYVNIIIDIIWRWWWKVRGQILVLELLLLLDERWERAPIGGLLHFFLLLEKSLPYDNLLQAMLALNYILQTAAILSLSLHQLDETIGNLIPLPVNHDIQYTSQSNSLRAQRHTLAHMKANVTIWKRLPSQHHDRLPFYLGHFLLEKLQINDDKFGWSRHI